MGTIARTNIHAACVAFALASFSSAIGCEASSATSTEAQADEAAATSSSLRWRPRRHRHDNDNGAAGTSGTPGTPGTAGSAAEPPPSSSDSCDVCASAQACCNVVANNGPLCTYDASYCESLDATRRQAYVVNCKTLLVLTRSVWSSPPAACQ